MYNYQVNDQVNFETISYSIIQLTIIQYDRLTLPMPTSNQDEKEQSFNARPQGREKGKFKMEKVSQTTKGNKTIIGCKIRKLPMTLKRTPQRNSVEVLTKQRQSTPCGRH